jgi:hypothetical protein
VLPGVRSEKGFNLEVYILELLTTPLDPKRFGITRLLRFAGVIRDFQSQGLKSAGVARSFPLRNSFAPALEAGAEATSICCRVLNLTQL